MVAGQIEKFGGLLQFDWSRLAVPDRQISASDRFLIDHGLEIQRLTRRGKINNELKKPETSEEMVRGMLGILRRTFQSAWEVDTTVSRFEFVESILSHEKQVLTSIVPLDPTRNREIHQMWKIFTDLNIQKSDELKMAVPTVSGKQFVGFMAELAYGVRSLDKESSLWKTFDTLYQNPFPDPEFPIGVPRDNFFGESRILLGLSKR